MPVLVLGTLHLFYAVVLHFPIFFNGAFPLFGVFLSGLRGILFLDISIVCLLFLSWGVMGLRIWAWWGSLAYWVLMTSSMISTFATFSYLDILAVARFPPAEMEILDGLPLEGLHFAALAGIPLLATLGVVLLARPHFHRTKTALGA